ncbi:hypothetical protein MUP59_08555, partial [Candidatus Bathyarchaeota archaeon]|nr:hypothetical protein [Candidatus Bathyarchaeota archaeon]
LAIMCNTTETHFLGAWHSDFSGRIAVKRKTEFISKEDGVMRTCSKYKVMGYQELELFKKWLLNTYPLTLGKVQLKR